MNERVCSRKDNTMAYVDPDYPTKKAFKEAVANGVEHRPYVSGGLFPIKGKHETIEGPHYPQPHRWYASVEMVDGVVVKVS